MCHFGDVGHFSDISDPAIKMEKWLESHYTVDEEDSREKEKLAVLESILSLVIDTVVNLSNFPFEEICGSHNCHIAGITFFFVCDFM